VVLCARFAIAVLILCGLGNSAWRSAVRSRRLEIRQGQDSNTLHYCVDARDPDLPVARPDREAIAVRCAAAQRHSVGENVVADEIDTLYRFFLNLRYLSRIQTASRRLSGLDDTVAGLLSRGYVVVAADAGWKSLATCRASKPSAQPWHERHIRSFNICCPCRRPIAGAAFRCRPTKRRCVPYCAHRGRSSGLGAVALGSAGKRSGTRQAQVITPTPLPVSTVDIGSPCCRTRRSCAAAVDRAMSGS